jgi:outer membrane protein
MKKILLLVCMVSAAAFAQAQKYAIIDTKYILDKMPEYRTAQGQLDNFAALWQKKKREDQLFIKEKEVRDLQRQRFGFEGDLFKKRGELIKPIQDRVYNAVQKLAVQRGYDFILDKSEGITVIFADPKLEKSDDVLKELGVK